MSRKTAPPVAADRKVLNDLSKRAIDSALTVSRTLGSGLPHIIYENALAHELRNSGLQVAQQHSIGVYYDGIIVGDYTADLLVENTILLEMTVVRSGDAIDTARCLKYLKATGYPVCLVLNFGKSGLGVKHVRKRA
jgi:GxxExxY protein